MSFADFFHKDTSPLDLNKINKSFRRGQAMNNPVVDALDVVGTTSNTKNGKDNLKQAEKLDDMDKHSIVRYKQQLNQYSKNILIQSIIRTRTNQIIKYCTPSQWTADGIGYHIVPCKAQDTPLTKDQQKEIDELEKFIYYTGTEKRDWRDTFPNFIVKLLDNLFVQDQINIERIFDTKRSNNLNHFNIVDSSTIIISKHPNSLDEPREFEQIINGKTVNHFTEKELTFITYWSQSDVNYRGYGVSPVTIARNHVRYHSDTEQFNARFFTQGGTTRGLLVINAQGEQQSSRVALESIRRAWQPLQGVNGAWKIPMITAQDAKYVNMTQSSKDMEFSQWLNYLINIVTSVFQIQPEEINFANRGGATGKFQGTTLNEGNTLKSKLEASKDKGLQPLLRFIERVINDKILYYKNPNYRFEFTLGDTNTEQDKIANILEREKAGMTLNEGRSMMGLPPLPNGNVAGNSNNLIQYLNTVKESDPDFQSTISQMHSQADDHGLPDLLKPNAPNNNENMVDNSANTTQATNHANLDGANASKYDPQSAVRNGDNQTATNSTGIGTVNPQK